MSNVALRMDRVYKKFSRGEQHDALRDLLPALAKRLVRGSKPAGLRDEEFWVLNNVSFEIKRGEAVGIVGHNGAGKSTMLKHLSGILKPTSGTIEVNGRLSALIEVGAGFHTDLTGRENIFLNGVILGMSRAEVRAKFDEIVEFSGLEDFIDTPVKRYSSGMYARLGFSVAAHLDPAILIIDEVLSVGDQAFQTKSINKMRSILSSGVTVIFVSHNLRAVADLCDRALLLRKGEILEDGPTSKIIHSYMEQIKTARRHGPDQQLVIDDVRVFGSDGKQRYDFESGETSRVQVTMKALKPIGGADCYLYLLNDQYQRIFTTSGEQLGLATLKMEAGEVRTWQFDLDLHLGPGSYHLGMHLFKNETQQVLDRVEPAATILITHDLPVRGTVNLYPRASISRNSAPAARDVASAVT